MICWSESFHARETGFADTLADGDVGRASLLAVFPFMSKLFGLRGYRWVGIANGSELHYWTGTSSILFLSLDGVV